MSDSYVNTIIKTPDKDSTWIYLSDWILAAFLGIFLVLMFDRYVGMLMTKGFHLLLWRYAKVRISVESFKISFLAGRIFAKNVTVVNADTSVSMLKVTITWRYWLFRRTRLSSFLVNQPSDATSEDTNPNNDSLPTRIMVVIDGLEVFVMNRTWAYEDILAKMGGNPEKSPDKTSASSGSSSSSTRHFSNDEGELRARQKNGAVTHERITHAAKPLPKSKEGPPKILAVLLRFVPIGVSVKRGAVVVGNPTVPTLACMSYKSAQGIIDLAHAPNVRDHYRWIYNVNLEKFQVAFRDNIGYDPARYDSDTLRKRPGNVYVTQLSRGVAAIGKMLTKLHLKPRPRAAPARGTAREWFGLARYHEDDDGANVYVINDEEYAKVPMVVDTASARVCYYYDVCGTMGPGGQTGGPQGNDPLPEHALEIEVSEGVIQYGAWADKQRIPLQNVLIPMLARDQPPSPTDYTVGAQREYAGFTLSLQVKDEMVVKVPTREPNKDKEMLSRHIAAAKTTRPFGWLELAMGAESNFGVYMSFVSTAAGTPHRLDGFFNKLEVRTSVNHDVLFSAENHELVADIGFPLAWNGPCCWTFDNVSTGGRLFLLREHAFLISDIFSDFASGEPTPYEFLKDFTYRFNWRLAQYALYFNVNDHNIISNPLDFDNNTYLRFQGDELVANLSVLLRGPLTKCTTVNYHMETPGFELIVDTPPWHTVSAFMKESKAVGQSGRFTVDGGYTFYDVIEVNASNYVELRCVGDDIALKFYGFVIKYFFIICDNYFGEFIHFKTVEEYTSGVEQPPPEDPEKKVDYWKILKTDNDIDVFFTFQVRRGAILLPGHLYDSTNHVSVCFDALDIDIRFTNYYMDLQVDFSPTFGAHINSPLGKFQQYWNMVEAAGPSISVDGLNIHGHRMFGIPPDEITYNAKWDFDAGEIAIMGGPEVLMTLIKGINLFAFGFMDTENSLNIPMPAVYDAFNITFRCPWVCLGMNDDDGHRIVADIRRLVVSFSDYPSKRYSGRVTILMPEIEVRVEHNQTIQAALVTAAVLSVFMLKKNAEQVRQIQQAHLKKNDAPFHRNPFLLFDEYRDHEYDAAQGCFLTSLSLPDANAPLVASDDSSGGSHLSDYDDEPAGARFMPTVNYNEEDFAPTTEVDPEFEYDNIVLELADTKGFVSVASATSVLEVLTPLGRVSLESAMDNLQTKVVSGIKQLMGEKKAVLTARVTIPSLHLSIGEFATGLDWEARVFGKTPVIPVTNVYVSEASLAYSSKMEKPLGGHLIPDVADTFAVHVKQVSVSISNPTEFQPPVSIIVADIEAWSDSHSGEDSVGSVSVDRVSADVDAAQSEWLVDYATQVVADVMPVAAMAQRVFANLDSPAKLVYILTKASTEFDIDHDPGVLTKPAYVLRSRKNHVRFYDGWKLTARIRHILQSLPMEWRHQPDMFARPLPDDAYDQVVEIFSHWRGWEAIAEQRRFFFNYIFDRLPPAPFQGFHVDFHGTSASFKLHQGSDIDTIALAQMGVSLRLYEIHNAATNKFGIEWIDRAESWEGSVNVGSLTCALSSITLDLLARAPWTRFEHQVMQTTTAVQKEAPQPVGAPKEKHSVIVSGVVSVAYDVTLTLPHTSLELSGSVTADTEVIDLNQPSSSTPLMASVAMSWGFDVAVFAEGVPAALLSLEVGEGDTVTGFCGDSVKTVDVSVGRVAITAGNNQLVTCLDALVEDAVHVAGKIDQLQHALSNQAASELAPITGKELVVVSEASVASKSTGHSNNPFAKLGEVSGVLVVREGVITVDFDPLRVQARSQGLELKVAKLVELAVVEAVLARTSITAKLAQVSVLDITSSQVGGSVRMVPVGPDEWAVNAAVAMMMTKIQIPQLVNAIKAGLVHEHILEDQVKSVVEWIDSDRGLARLQKLGDKEKPAEPAPEPTPSKLKLLYKFAFSNDFVSVSTHVNETQIAIELHEIASGVYNVESMMAGPHVLVPVFGDFAVNSFKFIVLDRTINVNHSTVVDFNMSMRVLNAENNGEMSQALQLKSQWCRVCGCASTLTRMLGCIDVAMAVWSTRKRRDAPVGLGIGHKEPNSSPEISDSESVAEDKSLFDYFSAVNILAYNFSVGWLFNGSRKDYPGITFGAERFFATVERYLGKFTLLDAYISVAHGFRTSNFYPTGSELSSLNRAFLPKMQVVYSIVDTPAGKDMRVSVVGDQVDIKFLSNSVVISEQLLESVSEVNRYMDNRKRWERPQGPATPKPATPKSTEPHQFTPWFSQVEVSATFEGSKILLYRIEHCEPDSPESLFLHSPAVKLALFYQHCRGAARKHVFRGDVLTCSSANTLHSSCVPVLQDIVEGIRRIMRKTNKTVSHPGSPTPMSPGPLSPRGASSPTPMSPRVASPKPHQPASDPGPSEPAGFKHVMSEVDMHIGVRIESQALTMSCEPTAKVGAVVSMDGINFQINSDTAHGVPVVQSSLYVQHIQASLQHIYSRDISGSVSLHQIIWSSVLELGEVTSILSSGSVVDVDGYIKMQQIQDLELFKDIWLPSREPVPKEHRAAPIELTSQTNLAQRFKEVSTTLAFPWMLTLVVTRVGARVDFGPSLGSFRLSIDQAWAVSRKQLDWTQDLKLGVNEVELTSVGRLGAAVHLKRLNIHTAISWQLASDKTVDVPLIMISAGWERLDAKLSFDHHVFALAFVDQLSVEVYNQKSELSISKDHLSVQIVCGAAEVYITSLFASAMWDIHNTVSRMMAEKRTSYRETLKDSAPATDSTPTSKPVPESAILEAVKKLESRIQLSVGQLRVYVFPSSFEDSKVLVVKLDQSRAQFSQNEYSNGITNELELKFTDLHISLSRTQRCSEEFVSSCTVAEFVDVAHHARGGGIFVFPRFRVSMRSFQKYDNNVVEYLYQQSFGSTVDVRWNLGSVNFIREMYSVHQRALESRTGYAKAHRESVVAGIRQPSTSSSFKDDPSDAIEQTLDETISKVAKSSSYEYRPLAPPIIEAPQLKELGNATPPLEWFGLHRDTFPNITHQTAIVPLQRVIHEVVSQYSKLLGKA
ncbi:protein Csf1p [Diutina catenulata]